MTSIEQQPKRFVKEVLCAHCNEWFFKVRAKIVNIADYACPSCRYHGKYNCVTCGTPTCGSELDGKHGVCHACSDKKLYGCTFTRRFSKSYEKRAAQLKNMLIKLKKRKAVKISHTSVPTRILSPTADHHIFVLSSSDDPKQPYHATSSVAALVSSDSVVSPTSTTVSATTDVDVASAVANEDTKSESSEVWSELWGCNLPCGLNENSLESVIAHLRSLGDTQTRAKCLIRYLENQNNLENQNKRKKTDVVPVVLRHVSSAFGTEFHALQYFGYAQHQPKDAEDICCWYRNVLYGHAFRGFGVIDGHGGPHHTESAHVVAHVDNHLYLEIFTDLLTRVPDDALRGNVDHSAVRFCLLECVQSLDREMSLLKLQFGATFSGVVCLDSEKKAFVVNLGGFTILFDGDFNCVYSTKKQAYLPFTAEPKSTCTFGNFNEKTRASTVESEVSPAFCRSQYSQLFALSFTLGAVLPPDTPLETGMKLMAQTKDILQQNPHFYLTAVARRLVLNLTNHPAWNGHDTTVALSRIW